MDGCKGSVTWNTLTSDAETMFPYPADSAAGSRGLSCIHSKQVISKRLDSSTRSTCRSLGTGDPQTQHVSPQCWCPRHHAPIASQHIGSLLCDSSMCIPLLSPLETWSAFLVDDISFSYLLSSTPEVSLYDPSDYACRYTYFVRVLAAGCFVAVETQASVSW